MSVQLAWGITGAGHFLIETFSIMSKIMKTNDVKVTTFLSSAGAEVVRMYGLWGKLNEISPGGYYEEILTEETEGASAPSAGRLERKMYGALIVSPASANTVAKVVLGIADTLVTNAIAHAQKGRTPIYIVPTDQKLGFVETIMPHRVERSECKACEQCLAVNACKYSAISIIGGKARIDLSKCYGCGLCVKACPFGAIKFGEKIRAYIRKIDVENVKKLKNMRGITVLKHPAEIENILRRHLGKI